MRKIIHVDMDAFYASVEQLDDPSLRGKPVAVGGSRARGVIAAASYEARRYGLRSAMPSSKAYRLCPQVIFVPPRFARYKEISGQIRQIFLKWTPLVEPLSLDEAYLDITENYFNEPSARKVATEIKHQIKAETGLTASAGVSYNKFLAKIASDYHKPDGLFVIPPAKAEAFIEKLPIEKFFGIGKVTAERMKAMGISTGADLKRLSEVELAGSFGKSGRYYYRIVRGIDERAVDPNRARKSISVETTFESDLNSLEGLRPVLLKLNQELWRRLERTKLMGRTLTIKVKYTDFSLCTRSVTVEQFVEGPEPTMLMAEELLREVPELEKGVRLIGLGFSKLNNEQSGFDGQLSLEL